MPDTKYDRTLLYGLPVIAAYMGVGVTTVRRWYRKEGFPLGKLPKGWWATSTELIDRWLLARDPARHTDRTP